MTPGGTMHPNSLANLRPKEKGVSGNPKGNNGRFGLTPIITRILQETSPNSDKTNAELIVEAIIKECKRGNPVLIKELLNRMDGAVATGLNVTSESTLGIVVVPNKIEIEETEEK